MKTLVCLVEGESEKVMLAGILRRLLPECTPKPIVIPFNGKKGMEKRLEHVLREWKMPNTVFLILRDQDAADCKAVKRRLVEICRAAGKQEVLVRIACHELESFYFGDLRAVEKGLDLKNLTQLSEKREYRDPDQIAKPSAEMDRIIGRMYQKISDSRKIACHLSLESNASQSFRALLSGIKKLLQLA